MSARVYILLDVVAGTSGQVTEALRGKPGVVMADPLEGPPDVILVLEAPKRRKLAELTIQALASVEIVTEGMRLLPLKVD